MKIMRLYQLSSWLDESPEEWLPIACVAQCDQIRLGDFV
jgi:hypothetical protein